MLPVHLPRRIASHTHTQHFFSEKGGITLVHSTTLPFCRKLPGTKKNDTRTPGRSSHHQLQLRQLPQAEVRRDPPSTTLKDSKTLVRAAKASTMDHPRRLDSVERKQPSSQRGRKRKRIHPGDLGGTRRKEIPWSQGTTATREQEASQGDEVDSSSNQKRAGRHKSLHQDRQRIGTEQKLTSQPNQRS